MSADSIGQRLRRLGEQQLQRRRLTVHARSESAAGPRASVGGRAVVDFCSNDYLGLARHPQLAQAMCEAAARHGVGSGASHLVSGHGAVHAQLEEELAAFTGRERALLFSTGYMANLAVITAFAGRGDTVLLDRLSHASLIDAARLSGARLRRYAHADAAAAQRLLARTGRGAGANAARISGSATLLVTDGVFSMDGDLAPLPELAAAAQAVDALLIVDDAHGLGVIGATGGGILEQQQIGAGAAPLLMGTLGKAFGCFGAFVAGPGELIEWLLQTARPYIYTTALPPPVAAAASAALALCRSEPWRRERVRMLTEQFRRAAAAAGVPLSPSQTPIQPIILGTAARALAASSRLFEAGLWVTAIRPPTVPAGSSRLRITLSAAHTTQQVEALAAALGNILRGLPAAPVELAPAHEQPADPGPAAIPAAQLPAAAHEHAACD